MKKDACDLNRFTNSIISIMSIVHEYGLKKAKKIVEVECYCKQKGLFK